FMQPSKSVSSEITTEPLEMGWMSCATLILPPGRNTTEGIPAAAQYAARAAEVSPVEAQATARIGTPSLRMRFTCDTSTVMPRSLNEPVWELPHSLTHKSLRPSCSPRRLA